MIAIQTANSPKEKKVDGLISRISRKGLSIRISATMTGFLPVVCLTKKFQENPLKDYSVGMQLEKMIILREAQPNVSQPGVLVGLTKPKTKVSSLAELIGKKVKGYVTYLASDHVIVSFLTHCEFIPQKEGVLDITEMPLGIKDFSHMSDFYPIHSMIEVRVMGFEAQAQRMIVSQRSPKDISFFGKMQIGQWTRAKLLVPVQNGWSAQVSAVNFGIVSDPPADAANGKVIPCWIHDVSESRNGADRFVAKTTTEGLEDFMEEDQEPFEMMCLDPPVKDPEEHASSEDDEIQDEAQQKTMLVNHLIQHSIPSKVEANAEQTPSFGFDWNPNSNSNASEEFVPQPVIKKQKRELEEEIRQYEMTVARGENLPKNNSDFEKLILGSPNSSVIWIRYMAYHVSINQIEKARSIAERGTKSINFQEEKERMNMWVAWLNLENSWGTLEDFEKVLEKAKLAMSPKSILLKAGEIYETSNNLDKAIEIYTSVTTKYRKDIVGWEKLASCLLRNNQRNEFQKLQSTIIKILEKKEHVGLLSKFAILEYKYGLPARGKDLLESLVSNYPKRADIWNIYLDCEIKSNQGVKAIRGIFERTISLKLAPKKMKNFFSRYLNFEKDYGSEESAEKVRQKALAYATKDEDE